MSGLFSTKEVKLRRAFGRWITGGKPDPIIQLGELAGNDRGASTCLSLAQAENGEALTALTNLENTPKVIRATALLWAGQAEKAIILLEGENNPLAGAIRGLALLENDQPEEAARIWQKNSPTSWRLTGPRALTLIIQAHATKDREALQQRLAADLLDPPPPPPPLAVALFRHGLDCLEMIGPTITGNRPAKERIRILSLQARGKITEAIQQATKLRKDLQGEEWPRNLLVDLLATAGEDQRIIDLDPKGEEMPVRVAIALARRGNWAEAHRLITPILAGDDADIFCVYTAACAQTLAGDIPGATHSFIRLRAMDEIAFVDISGRETKAFCQAN